MRCVNGGMDLKQKVLTIIISTCNRCNIVMKNIKRMLMTDCDDVEFVICDNASDDNTWNQIQTITDERVRKKHNEINYGFENFWLVSAEANTSYFMFVNDRDYIEPQEINEICRLLRKNDKVDFISNERREMAPGYYNWQEAIGIYFQSRHPGTLIYNTAFINKNMDRDIIQTFLDQGKAELANNYLVFQLLLNVERVYLNVRNPINQPLNRERIPKVRKEYYTAPYISLEYRIKEYNDWIKKGLEYINHPRISKIMLAIYKDSLMTVTWEYYFSMKIPGMAKRNNYDDHRVGEWKKNGFLFFLHVIGNSDFKRFGINKRIWRLTVKNYIETLKRVMEWA